MSNQLRDKPHCSILSLPGSTQFQPDPKAWFLKTSIHQPLDWDRQRPGRRG
jgi:hypothetical protein